MSLVTEASTEHITRSRDECPIQDRSITYKAKKLTTLGNSLKLSVNIYIILERGVIILIIIYLEKAPSL